MAEPTPSHLRILFWVALAVGLLCVVVGLLFWGALDVGDGIGWLLAGIGLWVFATIALRGAAWAAWATGAVALVAGLVALLAAGRVIDHEPTSYARAVLFLLVIGLVGTVVVALRSAFAGRKAAAGDARPSDDGPPMEPPGQEDDEEVMAELAPQ